LRLARSAIFDIDTVATASPNALLGVEVVAEHVCVSELRGDGFWVTPDQDQESRRTFVVPAEGRLVKVRVGESVMLHGEVRLTPSLMHERADASLRTSRARSQPTPYVYAYTVRPAWPNANQRQRRTRSDLCVSSRRDEVRAE
jgi:hypothetical protein